MALWQFTHLNKHGNFRQRIIHTKGALSLPGGGLGPHVMASRFKYKYEEPVMAPSLFKTNGKTYLMPIWKEVVEGTTLAYSPDSGNFYCNCPGRWRAHDGKCKHIKALESKIK